MFRWLALAACLAMPLVSGADPTKLADPARCHVPKLIPIVGGSNGVADPAGRFAVEVRDFSDYPKDGALVVIDFSDCTDLRLASTAPSGCWSDCASSTFRTFTDATGTAWLCVAGAGRNRGGEPGAGAHAAHVFADGVRLGDATVAIYDQNGAVSEPGLEVTDLTAMMRDMGTGWYFGRSDYNGDGVIDVVDLSLILSALGRGTSAEGVPPYCP